MQCTVIRHGVLISCTQINSHTTVRNTGSSFQPVMQGTVKGASCGKSRVYLAEFDQREKVLSFGIFADSTTRVVVGLFYCHMKNSIFDDILKSTDLSL